MSLKPALLQEHFQSTQNLLPRDLGDDLVLRFATVADTEPLAEFTGRVFGGGTRIDEMAVQYTRDMMRADHPIIGASNVLIVEDTRANKIASTTCLIPQAWTYAGIPFGVGRPEMVATDPAYRRRGLVCKQFEVLHAMSEAMGHLLQGITGISWYYRQFDYEYALDLGGGRVVPFSNIPTLKENESEPFRLRAATFDDIPFLMQLYDRECTRSLVACPRDRAMWRYMLEPLPESMMWRVPYQIIETNDGRAVGYFAPACDIWADTIPIFELSAIAEQSMRAVLPTVLRWMKVFGPAEAARQGKTIKGIQLTFGDTHPAFDAIPDLATQPRLPYGWYIRVPNVPKFLRHIAPALQDRLARSAMAGYSGELKISEYRRGFKLIFENGALTNVESWQPMPEDGGDCGFPPLVFLQLLFGRKSLFELRQAFADVNAKDETQVLLDALFPKMYSCVNAVS